MTLLKDWRFKPWKTDAAEGERSAAQFEDARLEAARRAMIETQIERRGVPTHQDYFFELVAPRIILPEFSTVSCNYWI